jgi:predicted RNase H-like HicB family nuclease
MTAVSGEQHYSVVIEWSDDDQVYIVSLPEWGPGARTHGATYDEAVRNAQDVLELLIAGAQQKGKPLPAPHLSRPAGRPDAQDSRACAHRRYRGQG